MISQCLKIFINIFFFFYSKETTSAQNVCSDDDLLTLQSYQERVGGVSKDCASNSEEALSATNIGDHPERLQIIEECTEQSNAEVVIKEHFEEEDTLIVVTKILEDLITHITEKTEKKRKKKKKKSKEGNFGMAHFLQLLNENEQNAETTSTQDHLETNPTEIIAEVRFIYIS